MRRSGPYVPSSHGVRKVGDRRVLSGIVFVIRTGAPLTRRADRLRPCKTIYNRFNRWDRLGVFNRIFAGLAAEGACPTSL